MAQRAHAYSTGDPRFDELLEELVKELPSRDRKLAFEILSTALKLAREQVSTLDRKIVNSSLKELRQAFRVFAPYKDVRKVSVFGSARVEKGDAEYEVARRFSQLMAERDWMVITGAGPGIMEAGHEGAGGALSFGANILLPFEAKPNPVIADDAKLINFKYFFTRKLTFMKEAHAFVCLPGGFGTLDETFELLTLVQTGKAALQPIVLLESEGGTYWQHFDRYLKDELLTRNFVDEDDMALYRITTDPQKAVDELTQFYRVYHSDRMVGERLVLRLKTKPDEETLQKLNDEFADIMAGPIEVVETSPIERKDDDVPDLPRIGFVFDRRHVGRLRKLVDRLNVLVPPPSEADSSEVEPGQTRDDGAARR
jgi:uncharacterized protein (TIGR00730 family)